MANNTWFKLTGLWRKQTKDGKYFMSGKLSYSAGVIIWPNPNKREAKDPDYLLYLAPEQTHKQEQKQEGAKEKATPAGGFPDPGGWVEPPIMQEPPF